MTRAVRLPVALLAIVSAVLVAGGVAWARSRHLTCEDSGQGRDQGLVLLARWGGLATAALGLSAALICSARARRGRPSAGFSVFAAAAVAWGLVACLVPHVPDWARGPLAPFAYVLVAATLAVYFVVPALVLLAVFVATAARLARVAGGDRRVIRGVQALSLWFALVLAPGCAGVGLLSQFPICLD